MDWLTGGITLLAMELVARKKWQGWAVGLGNQVLWAWLIWTRELWGLAPLTVVLSWRYTAAMLRWREADSGLKGARDDEAPLDNSIGGRDGGR